MVMWASTEKIQGKSKFLLGWGFFVKSLRVRRLGCVNGFPPKLPEARESESRASSAWRFLIFS